MRLHTIIRTPEPRYVIVHYHIFKNGGSTIESILEREFARSFATLHGPDSSSTLDGRHLASFLRRHPHIEAVSSHHLRYPKPSIRHMVIFDCCFLRHPLERLDSLYRYLQSVDSSDPLCRAAREQNPREFFSRLVQDSPHIVSNIQVTQLACSGAFTRAAHPRDLDRAAEVFCEMAIPGLVEMFDESLMAAEYSLNPAFPAVSLEYIPQNVSRPTALRPQREPDRRERLIRLWGAGLYEELVRLNQLDLELFRRAEAEILRRAALVPNSGQRLDEFRSRCENAERLSARTLQRSGRSS